MNNTFVFLVSQDLGLSSPLKQFNSGIAANDVKCEQGLQLVIKLEDGSPACVTSDTAQKLMEHRWTKNQIGVSTLAKPSIGLYHVTTSLQPVILGMSFFINAEVVNNQNTPITYYGGCISPLSVSFDNIQTHTDGYTVLPSQNTFLDHMNKYPFKATKSILYTTELVQTMLMLN